MEVDLPLDNIMECLQNIVCDYLFHQNP